MGICRRAGQCPSMETTGLLLWMLVGLSQSVQREGPNFIIEPPSRVDFLNSTGVVVPCTADGLPSPALYWQRSDGSAVTEISGLRQIRADGSLIFLPFRAEDYRQDIHAGAYRCVASNVVGSIASREVRVRAAVYQYYEAQVYDEFVVTGNTAVLRCHIPSFVKEYVTVVSWIRDDGLVIRPDSGGRFSLFATGELHIRHVDPKTDGDRFYFCQTRHRISGEVRRSVTSGQLIITGARTNFAPRVTDRKSHVWTTQGRKTEIPCSAQGSPPPQYRWFKHENSRLFPVKFGGRILQVDGTLAFQKTSVTDSGKYLCLVNNTIGEDKVETELVVTAPLSMTVSPRRVVAEEGQAVTFNCSLTGHPVRSVSWLKNLRPLVVSGRVQLVSREQLLLAHVLREDKGMYQCFASNDWETAQGTAELNLGDDPPVFSFTFPEQTLEPGPSVSLKCAATGSPLPQITWTLDGTPIADNLRVRVGDFVTSDGFVNSFVNISSLRVEDGGRYHCQAVNEVAYIVHAAKVNVFGKPFVRAMANVTVLGGSALVLHCPASGYPIKEIYWKKGEARLPHNRRQTAFLNGTMVVEKVDRAMDEGKYQCTASNEKGEKASKSTYVRVLVAPAINPFSFPANLKKGMRSIVTCSVLEGDSPISIDWQKNGQRILSTKDDITIDSSNEFSSTLYVKSVDYSHNGNYTCVASNMAASTNFTATMIVNVPPEWRLAPTDTSVVMGQSVVIDCQAEGFPQPRIWWERSPGADAPAYRTIISNSHMHTLENGSLMIREAEESDSGLFLCQASNGIGTALSKVIRITVHVAAHFRSRFRTVTHRGGETAKLPCKAFGESPIVFTWKKERNLLDPNKPRIQITNSEAKEGAYSELVLLNLERQDSALYTCRAKNAYGEDDCSIQLVVQELPDPPTNVVASDVTSRTITLTWTSPFNGNSPITSYKIEYKEDGDSWTGAVTKSVTVPGAEPSISLRALKPVTNYAVRISAENSLGWSQASSTFYVSTGEEAPEGPPDGVQATAGSSRSLRVTWQPPKKDFRNGHIKGYYVGYRAHESQDSFVYKTIEIKENFKEETVITGLKRAVKYIIVVQAFNSKGSGPPSEEIIAETLENDPPATVTMSVAGTTQNSVHLNWDTPQADSPPVTGFTLYSRKEFGNWEDRQVAPHQTNYNFQDLACGSLYQFYMEAYNSVGKSEPSDIVTAKTQGSVPVAPTKDGFIDVNSSAASLQLSQWQSSGCPIKSFVVHYKASNQKEWVLVSSNIVPEQKLLVIRDLAPGTFYNVMVLAKTDAGTTEEDYLLATLTASGVPPSLAVDERKSTIYRLLGILVPGACAVVVLFVIFLVACVLIRKRRRNNNAPIRESRLQEEKSVEGMTMSVLDRKSVDSDGGGLNKDALYYPSPYATSHVPGLHGKHAYQEGETSQNIRRTLGRREHIYEVPYPPPKWEDDEDTYSHIMESSSVPLHPSTPVTRATAREPPTLSEGRQQPLEVSPKVTSCRKRNATVTFGNSFTLKPPKKCTCLYWTRRTSVVCTSRDKGPGPFLTSFGTCSPDEPWRGDRSTHVTFCPAASHQQPNKRASEFYEH